MAPFLSLFGLRENGTTDLFERNEAKTYIYLAEMSTLPPVIPRAPHRLIAVSLRG